jgi:hypothetical protein
VATGVDVEAGVDVGGGVVVGEFVAHADASSNAMKTLARHTSGAYFSFNLRS